MFARNECSREVKHHVQEHAASAENNVYSLEGKFTNYHVLYHDHELLCLQDRIFSFYFFRLKLANQTIMDWETKYLF